MIMTRKQISIFVFTIFLLAFTIGSWGQNINLTGSGKYFEVGIEQDGKSVSIKNHQVILQKKPFTIVLYLKQPDGILINASIAAESFESASAGKPLKDIIGFSETGMAEDTFNPKAVLIISSRAPHYWYYTNDAKHRFNDVSREKNLFICKRIVANVWYLETTKEFVSLKDMPGDRLYLVFMKTEWTKDAAQQIEKQREYVKINFR